MTLQVRAPQRQLARLTSTAPRRVLMTVDSVGGVWRYAVDLASSLQTSGLRISLVGFGPEPSRTQVAETKAARLALTWSERPLDWMPGGIGALPEVHAEIARAADRFKADVVHVNSIAFAGSEIAQPIVSVAHSCVPTWWRCVRSSSAPAQWKAHISANKKGLQAASCIIAPSQSHADLLRQEYGRALDIRVIYNASSQTQTSRRRREPLIFAAGRWWDEAKNARALDNAAELTQWPVMMAGSLHDPAGPRVSLSHARALGALDGATTREWMRRASIFVAPSIYEPFGLAALEAAHASTPLVLSDIPTFRELWDGAAVFANPTEPIAFVRAIDALMSDALLRRRLARRARERAVRFTLERQATLMMASYGAALSASADANQRSAG